MKNQENNGSASQFKNFARKIYLKLFGGHGLVSLLTKAIKDDWSVLDVGCGRDSILKYVNKGSYKVGVDIYEPYVKRATESNFYDEVIQADARKLPFESKSFDCAVAVEVLEHLDKSDGLVMLKELERVARKKVIMTTPNGFLNTYAGPADNPEEKHLSGYTAVEVKALGFRVHGLNGLKILWKVKKGQAVPRIRPSRLGRLLIDMTEMFAYHFPSVAFQFFFVKEVSL